MKINFTDNNQKSDPFTALVHVVSAILYHAQIHLGPHTHFTRGSSVLIGTVGSFHLKGKIVIHQ